MTSLNALVAGEHAADLRPAAKHHYSGQSHVASSAKVIALRLAEAEDARGLKILAALDEEPELTGHALLALIDGEAVAGMSLDDGRVVSNPFVATSDAVSLLKLRARHLFGAPVQRPRRRWLPRLAA